MSEPVRSGVYQVVFPVDDLERSVGELKEEARDRTRAAADSVGLIRTGKVQVDVTRGVAPMVTAQVRVRWTGRQPVISGAV